MYCVFRYADFSLALGSSDHDISTIFKQMRILYQDGYTQAERLDFRSTIWKDLLETSRSVVQALRALHTEPATHPSGVRFV
jgi:guanine nucleotide-binding protein G(i) subunit alpha